MKRYSCTSFVLICILFLVNPSTHAQEKRAITFTDKTGKPLEDVVVYYKGGKSTISNEDGIIYLNPSISVLTCHRLGYRDTVVVLRSPGPGTVRLTPEAQIEEVTVAQGYNPKEHLIRLRNEAHRQYREIDTTVFYQFTIRMENPKTDQETDFQGIVRVPTKSTLRFPSIFICRIDTFYSSPSMDDNLNFRFCDVRDILNQNILLEKNFRWKDIVKKQFNYLRDWNKADSTVFKQVLPPGTPIGVNLVFNQDKPKSFEWYFKQDKGLNTRQSGLLLHAMYSFIEYSSAEIPYPSTLKRTMRYRSKSGEDWIGMVTMTEIESLCNCEYDTIDNRYIYSKPIKWFVERIENQLNSK